MYSISGAVCGSSSPAIPSICSAISSDRDALAHHRLVDEEVEEPDLGLGDLPQRLRIDPDQLEQRDQREARCGGSPAICSQHLDVLVADPIGHRHRRAEQAHDPLDQLLLEPDRLRRLGSRVQARSPAGTRSSTEPNASRPSRTALADLAQRVAALPHPRDDARLRRGRRRPAPAADRQDRAAWPSASGSTRDPGAPRGLADRDRRSGSSHPSLLPDRCPTRATGPIGPVAPRAFGPLRSACGAIRRLAPAAPVALAREACGRLSSVSNRHRPGRPPCQGPPLAPDDERRESLRGHGTASSAIRPQRRHVDLSRDGPSARPRSARGRPRPAG